MAGIQPVGAEGQDSSASPAATWLYAGFVFAVALAVYWGTAVWAGHTQSPGLAYFDYLAEAFLQGRLYLANPPQTHDLTLYEGKWYVPFPPLPTLLMLPWVVWRGVAGTNTVLFSTLFAAANVALVYLMLQALADRGWTKLDHGGDLWLTLLFGLGSVHWYMATVGQVWFVAQICTVTFIALAVWLAIANGSPWLSGLSLALALAARPNVILVWPLLLGIAAERLRGADGPLDWRRTIRWALISLIPVALAVIGLLGYNVARFGHPFDFGYSNENIAARLVDDLRTYGQWHIHYIPRNLWAMWLALPQWDAARQSLTPNPEGMSLLLTTPALVCLVRARQRSPVVIGAWVAFGLLVILLATYYNTGWRQFGYRFSLDFMIPIMVLLAFAAGRRVSWQMRTLILLGLLVNAYGLHWWYYG